MYDSHKTRLDRLIDSDISIRLIEALSINRPNLYRTGIFHRMFPDVETNSGWKYVYGCNECVVAEE